MFPFSSSSVGKNVKKIAVKNRNNPKSNSQHKYKIPYHFKKNSIMTYSQWEIKKQLRKYPGLLRTLGHAYQYEIVFINPQKENQYWFCRNLEVTMPLLKYLNEKKWHIDWQEKPFSLRD